MTHAHTHTHTRTQVEVAYIADGSDWLPEAQDFVTNAHKDTADGFKQLGLQGPNLRIGSFASCVLDVVEKRALQFRVEFRVCLTAGCVVASRSYPSLVEKKA